MKPAKPKPTNNLAIKELNKLLRDFAKYLRGIEPALAETASPAERSAARKGVVGYIRELEHMAKEDDDGPGQRGVLPPETKA